MNLLILPFDHRSSFSKNILGIEGVPNPSQTEEIKRLKNLVFKGFLKVRENAENPEELGILVDEMYGLEILQEANKLGVVTSVGVEKSGLDIFDFEYGKKFGKHIDAIEPTYVKVLVRYNPENKKANKKQLERLKKLSDFCLKNNRKLLFELLVPPTEKDKNSEQDFEAVIRPEKTAEAIVEISEKVKANLWKLEGFSSEGWQQVLQVIPKDEKVIVLGRGEDAEKVKFWLQEGAKFDQIIGFAVGRTIFMEPLLGHLKNGVSEEDTINKIADNYKVFVDLWMNSRTD
ncbi:MAG TPA: DUF2090 domain-containing protein [candidate division WWE3 bacterium]|uniref:DUF2090 domain-containing protein n=1 Tax=candidate division WWE3 bacterium TaxID=2053526 RepID=A0A7C1DII9_UNCKA|nr:DUF2090 domain-containing protein [candidate division WWE3 bacterium]